MYNSKPPCGKSTPAPCKEQHTSTATEAALERTSADKSQEFPLRCERDLRGRHFITEKGSLWSAFSISHLNTEEEMALIMYWGMFGLGEMDSYISFTARGRGVVMLIPTLFWKCYIAQFLFQFEVYELCRLDSFTTHNNMKFHFASSFLFLYFLLLHTIYNIMCNTVLKALAILHVCIKIFFFSFFQWLILINLPLFMSFILSLDGLERLIKNQWKYVSLLIVWLFCDAQTPG